MAAPVPSAAPFGTTLRAVRTSRGMSLRELARQVGVAPSVVHAWERGHAHPTLGHLRDVLLALRAGQATCWRLVTGTESRVAA